MDLYPTPTRLALLRAIDAGDVAYRLDTSAHWHSMIRNGVKVDTRCEEMRAAGWIVLDDPEPAEPDRYPAARRWRPTAAGESEIPACVCGDTFADHEIHGTAGDRKAHACTVCDQCLTYRPVVSRAG
jgi:hypothetical protein